MAVYCSISDVSAELGGVTISGASTPTSTTVTGWIEQAEDAIDVLAGNIFTTAAVTSSDYEYLDYDGESVIRLRNYPVVSVESVEYEENGLGGSTASWVSLTEGRTTNENFILYKRPGLLYLHPNSTGNSPLVGNQNIRVTYTYGFTAVPDRVKMLCAKMVAQRYLESVASKTASSEGGAFSIGAISLSDPNNYAMNRLTDLRGEIESLKKEVVKTFKPRTYDLRLY